MAYDVISIILTLCALGISRHQNVHMDRLVNRGYRTSYSSGVIICFFFWHRNISGGCDFTGFKFLSVLFETRKKVRNQHWSFVPSQGPVFPK